MERMTWCAVVLLAAVACGGSRSPSATDSPGQAETYRCGSIELTQQELEEAPAATDLDEDARAALDGIEVPSIDPEDDWLVLWATDTELALIRQLEQPQDNGPGDVRTHEFVHVQTSQGATNLPEGAWILDAAGTCTPRLELDGLGDADLAMPATPEADATQVEVNVYEHACASGQPADDRIEIVQQRMTDEQLQLVIGVQPASGDQNCPGNPPTPVTIHLDQPLGDRTIVDASTLPPRPIPTSDPTTAD